MKIKTYIILIALSALSIESYSSAVKTIPGAMYDDMKACNAVGVYKQGNTNNGNTTNANSMISQENEILSHLKPDAENVQLKTNEFILYPNPTNDIVNLRYNTNQPCRIEIFDITGRKIKAVLFSSGYTKTTVSLENFMSGVYTYKFFVGEKLSKSGKIIKN
ncbi:MAG: T9SS type A sorting domain-containing protein [Chitinophagaceae bacterium]